VAMWNEGIAWSDEHIESMKEVMIVNREKMKLYGEYYDFGSDSCVIIIPGRGECLKYSYFFAKPYADAGLNVLVIDQRARGLSDGKYDTIGIKEHGDLLEWIAFLEKDHNVHKIWLHGVCIGAVSAILASVKENPLRSAPAPSSIKGLVLEGAFYNFRESFKEHMIDINRPVFPVLDECMHLIKKIAGESTNKYSPYNFIDKIDIPILFIYGREDKFSRPVKSRKIYEKCKSPDKQIVWFEHGAHSHLRLTNHEEYDRAVREFVSKYNVKREF